jgi:hypothetical protein
VARTEQLNLNLEKEAIVMRIITIVTLLYLPATFVSVGGLSLMSTAKRSKLTLLGTQTFFSTDIIKYQNPNGGSPGPGIFSSTAMTRWLQITLPLTAVTIFIAWLTYKSAERARQRRDEQPAQTYRYSPKAAESTAWLSFGVPWGGTMPILPLHNDEKRAS